MTRRTDELLDHEADGIREFDNDLPRWWLYGFYVTIAFAAIYLVNYHVLPVPLVGASTLTAEYDIEMRAAAGARPADAPAPVAAAVAALTDADSLAKGKAIFESPTSLCFSCHRADLGGLVGPDLTDGRWLHGCSAAELVTSIRTGYPPRGMLPYGSGAKLTDEQLRQVASYVLSRHGSTPPNPKPADPARDKACS
ncbi:MAG: cbb3-type cytochrome c oxidase N-terminal domain-containing protein [Vicinamibacteraceae bacterium]